MSNIGTTLKDDFLRFFRSEHYSDLLTSDEKREIFLTSLQGSSDITRELLEQLCSDYNTNLNDILGEQS